MFRGTADTDTSRKDQQQEERRRQERRQNEQNPNPNEERRENPRRQNMEMAPGRGEMNPDSPPQRENSSRNETSGNWQGENFQSGTSQAQKGEGQSPKQQSVTSERHEQRGEGTARSSHPSSGKEFGPGGGETGFGSSTPEKKRSNG
jgi:hypothetical protein